MKAISTTAFTLLTSLTLAQGLSLTAAQDLALTKNPLIPASLAKLQAARASATAMQAMFGPQLSVNAVGARGNGSMMFSPSAMGTNFAHAPEEGILAAGAMFEWNVFSFGRSSSVRAAANNMVAAANAEADTTKADVIQELRIEFARGLKIQAMVEGWRSQLEAATELERITNERYEAGKVPQAYVFRAKADRLKAERELAKAEAELTAAIAGVAALCGDDVADGVLGDWNVPMDVPESQEAALKIALQNSPEMKMFAAQAAEYRYRERAAQQSRLPQLSFSAMGDVLSRDSFGDRSGSNIGVLFSMPLFDSGARSAEAAEAKSKRINAESELANARNQVRRKMVSAWAQWSASSKVLASGEAELEAATEAYRIAKIRYEEGKSIQAEVSMALADLQMARAAAAEASEYKRAAWSNLRRALGTI